ncbi:S-adenosyl-L-methionine-dependent methyltransferase [Pyronema omphalodes]|nr:S-adenosyl-L-methionine-dependent methyltransferase [Pyronema omphalodes]
MVHRNGQQEVIEVDPAVLENRHLNDYAASGTASLCSSVNSYILENGRRYSTYFGVDRNPLPVDELEQDRLDMHHETMLQLLDYKLYLAPIEDPKTIIDIGTGTGIWAIDMADTFPDSEVIGVDLSPIQPVWVPPNCKFEVDDAEEEWPYPDNYFDFVHLRNITQGITDWPKLMAEVYRCTKPGGWVELAELGAIAHCDDGTMTEDNPINIYFQHLDKALKIMGRPAGNPETMASHLQKAGFINLGGDEKKQPLGPWPKDPRLKNIGAMVLLNTESGFHSYGMAVFTRVLGLHTDHADRLCADAFNAAKNKNNHIYNMFYVCYGRKPEENAESKEAKGKEKEKPTEPLQAHKDDERDDRGAVDDGEAKKEE